MKKYLLLLLLLLTLTMGCGITYDVSTKDLEDGLGKMTFEQAKAKWGEPTKVATEGGMISAFWDKSSHDGFIPQELYLKFSENDKVMREYRFVYMPPAP